VVAHLLNDADDLVTAVLVLGTLDADRARVLANEAIRYYVEDGWEAVRPEPGWWGTRMSYGRTSWERATKGGRAGVYFPEIVETAAVNDINGGI